MRYDANIFRGIDRDKAEEKMSGCCVSNDGSGCVQMTEKFCSVRMRAMFITPEIWLNS